MLLVGDGWLPFYTALQQIVTPTDSQYIFL